MPWGPLQRSIAKLEDNDVINLTQSYMAHSKQNRTLTLLEDVKYILMKKRGYNPAQA